MKIRIYQIKDAGERQKEMERLVSRPPLTAAGPVDESRYQRVFMGDVNQGRCAGRSGFHRGRHR